ncbi:MAG: hypothetical protein R2883_03780 [Caldisericia bacterium]
MSSQDSFSSDNKLLTLLNGVRQRDYKQGISVETLINVDKSHNRFEKFWIPLMAVLFVLVMFSGTELWPSILSKRIFEYLFNVSAHIYLIFKIFTTTIAGEFEKPVQYSLLIAVPIASVINVGTRLFVTKWSIWTPTYFGHVSCTATKGWLYPIFLKNNWMPLHIAFIVAVTLIPIIVSLHSKIKIKTLLMPYLFYMMAAPIFVIAVNIITAGSF